MIQITDKSKCSGCSACAETCAVGAIDMKADIQGFKYPQVDINKCVDCGQCDKVCPFINSVERVEQPISIYGCHLVSDEELLCSQSGGAFKAIADKALSDGYCVYGAAFDRNFSVKHICATTTEELDALRGSKYVQSNLDGIFHDILIKLKQGEKVLFSGVGCQVAGLKSLCRRRRVDTSNLLTIDIICYGVPSPQYWKDYLSYIRKTYKASVTEFKFRDKRKFGWNTNRSSFVLSDGRKIFPTYGFYNPLLFRRSCSACPFTSFSRLGDITIGDFWGIEKIKPEIFQENKGISLLMVNTDKGVQVFEGIKDSVYYFETTQTDACQQQLITPNPLHLDKERWEAIYCSKGFEKAIRKLKIIVEPNPVRMKLGAIKQKMKRVLLK